MAFPCLAFLLCVPPGREADCAGAFLARGIQAVVVGTLDSSGEVAVTDGGRRAVVIDLTVESVTGL
jgi:selenophosphate synthetase-related protein